MPRLIVATSRGGVSYDDMLIASDDGLWRNYRTPTWTRILSGAWTVAISPRGLPQIIFALDSRSNAGSTLMSSADGGVTWNDLSAGLPAHSPFAFFAWITVADGSSTNLFMSLWTFDDPSNPSVLYHSTDGGVSWSVYATAGTVAYGDDWSVSVDIKDRGSPSYLLLSVGAFDTNPQPANSEQNRITPAVITDQVEFRGMQVARASTLEYYWASESIGALYTPARAALILDSAAYGRGSWVESFPGFGGANLSSGWWVEPVSPTELWIVYAYDGPPFTTELGAALVTLTGGTYGPLSVPSGQVSTFYNVSFGAMPFTGSYYWGPGVAGAYNYVYRPFALGRSNPAHLWWLAGGGSVEYSPDNGATVQSQALVGMTGNNANTIWPLG